MITVMLKIEINRDDLQTLLDNSPFAKANLFEPNRDPFHIINSIAPDEWGAQAIKE